LTNNATKSEKYAQRPSAGEGADAKIGAHDSHEHLSLVAPKGVHRLTFGSHHARPCRLCQGRRPPACQQCLCTVQQTLGGADHGQRRDDGLLLALLHHFVARLAGLTSGSARAREGTGFIAAAGFVVMVQGCPKSSSSWPSRPLSWWARTSKTRRQTRALPRLSST